MHFAAGHGSTPPLRERPSRAAAILSLGNPDELRRMKDDCDKHGVVFEAVCMDSDCGRLRKDPEWDHEIETIVGNMEKAARA